MAVVISDADRRNKWITVTGSDMSRAGMHARLSVRVGSSLSATAEGPNGGVYLSLSYIKEEELEAFALGILNALHERRA